MKFNQLWSITPLARTALASDFQQQPLAGNLPSDLVQLSELENVIASSPLLAFHRNIVEIPSISGDEKDVGEFLLDFLSSHNFTVEKQLVTAVRREQRALQYLCLCQR